MNRHRAITPSLDAETIALVDALAAARGISSEDFAAEAIRRVAERETDLAAFVKVRVDQIERGEYVEHDQVMAELDQMAARHRSRCG